MNSATAQSNSSKWLTWPYYKPGTPNFVLVPQPGPSIEIMADADWDMKQAILQDLKDPTRFLSVTPDPQYANPVAYAMNLIVFAKGRTENGNAKYTVPADWEPNSVGLKYAQIAFGILQQIAVNKSDPDTVDVFTAWTHGTGQLYGGHPPSADVSPVAPSFNPSTSRGAAGTIFAS